jgi:chromosome segregation ATPase
MASNRFYLGIVAFSVSFVLSFVFTGWDLGKSCVTAFLTIIATYVAAYVVEKRHKNNQIFMRASLHKQIRELEHVKTRFINEINQLEAHQLGLYQESSQLQQQLNERRQQRDSLNRELNSYTVQKRQLETQANQLYNQVKNLESSKTELDKSISSLNGEKRRLELNFNVSKAEAIQLQNQINELQQQKEELDGSLILLNRLKQPLEEKTHDLRIEIEKLETDISQKNKFLFDKQTERESTVSTLNSLKTEILTKQTELENVKTQVILLQQERDQVQNQVWDLLQEIEAINPNSSPKHNHEDDENLELFPFSELLENLDQQPINFISNSEEDLPEEWVKFLQQLPNYEVQVLKAILEQDNPNSTIKEIAEANITMPNLLIDSINEIASNILGELIIEPNDGKPQISQEHISNLRQVIAVGSKGEEARGKRQEGRNNF